MSDGSTKNFPESKEHERSTAGITESVREEPEPHQHSRDHRSHEESLEQ